MEDKNTTFELRSEEVQEILTRVPHWMIRWGSLVVLFIFLSLFYVSWLIKYPDVIATQIMITTNVPPEKILAKTSGKIEAILVYDKVAVNVGKPLAIIENPANYQDVFLLKSILEKTNIDNNNFPFDLLKEKQFGDIESAFAVFYSAYVTEKLNRDLHPFQMENKAQHSEHIQIQSRLDLLQQQKSINESELVLQKNDLNRFETLLNKGVVSAQEFENKKLGYLQAEKNYKNLLSNISSLESSLIDNDRNSNGTRISGTKEDVNLESNKIQAFYQLKKSIKEWELNYVLRSSIKGNVAFLQIWTENQTVNVGDNVFAIIPSNDNGHIGKVKALAQNSGKIKIGQIVNIRLTNYPDREFGIIKGIVKTISLTPDKDGNLLIDVSLPKGLQTSYKKQIAFQQEMAGTADIVTQDLRLIERLLYQYRDIFKVN